MTEKYRINTDTLRHYALAIGWIPTRVEYTDYLYGDRFVDELWEFHDICGDMISDERIDDSIDFWAEEDLLFAHAEVIKEEFLKLEKSGG